MGLDLVPTGKNPPDEINVIIEIPKDAEPVKYEVDKATGAIFVDRVLSTPMRYPCNYGYVPHTIGGDGDPVDVLVLMPLPLIPGAEVSVACDRMSLAYRNYLKRHNVRYGVLRDD